MNSYTDLLESQTAALRAMLIPEIEAAWARMRAEDARAELNSVEPEYDVRDDRLDQIACMISVADDMLDHQWPPELHEAFMRLGTYFDYFGDLSQWAIDSFGAAYANAIADAYENAITQRRPDENQG